MQIETNRLLTTLRYNAMNSHRKLCPACGCYGKSKFLADNLLSSWATLGLYRKAFARWTPAWTSSTALPTLPLWFSSCSKWPFEGPPSSDPNRHILTKTKPLVWRNCTRKSHSKQFSETDKLLKRHLISGFLSLWASHIVKGMLWLY